MNMYIQTSKTCFIKRTDAHTFYYFRYELHIDNAHTKPRTLAVTAKC